MVVCGDVWWFRFFPGGLWWFAVICGGVSFIPAALSFVRVQSALKVTILHNK